MSARTRGVVVAIGIVLVGAVASGAAAASGGRTLMWEVLVDAPPERVWAAVFAPDAASSPISPRLDVELRVGGAVSIDTGRYRVTARVIALEAPWTLAAQVASVTPEEQRPRLLEGTRWTVHLQETATGVTVLRISADAEAHHSSTLRAWLGHAMLLELVRFRERLAR